MRLRAGPITLYVSRRWRLGRHVQWTSGGAVQGTYTVEDMPPELRHVPPDIAVQLGIVPPKMTYTQPRPKWRAWYMGWLELRVRC